MCIFTDILTLLLKRKPLTFHFNEHQLEAEYKEGDWTLKKAPERRAEIHLHVRWREHLLRSMSRLRVPCCLLFA